MVVQKRMGILHVTVEAEKGSRWLARLFPGIEKYLEIRYAGTVGEAIQLVQQQAAQESEFDLILLDWSLSSHPMLAHVTDLANAVETMPVVVLFAPSQEVLAVDALRHGAQDCLVVGQVDSSGLVRTLRFAEERHRLTRQVRASESRVRTIIEKTLDGILIVDHDGTILFANPAAESLFHRPSSDLIGNDFGFPLITDSPAELEIRRPHGSICIAEMRATALTWEGRPAYLATLRDVTAKRQDQERIETQLKQLRSLHTIDMAISQEKTGLFSTLDVVVQEVLDLMGMDAGRILIGDPHSGALVVGASHGFNTEPTQPMTFPSPDFFADKQPNQSYAHAVTMDGTWHPHPHLALLQEKEGFVFHAWTLLLVKDQAVGLLELFNRRAPDLDPAGQQERLAFLETIGTQAAIAVHNRELSSQADLLLRQARTQAQLTQQIIDTIPEGILVFDPDHRPILANPQARALLPDLDDTQSAPVLSRLGDRPVTDLLEPPSADLPWHEVSLSDPDRILQVASQPLTGAGLNGGWVLVMRDVTQERRRMKDAQAQERLATVGQMAAGIAHDFNNIMSAILLYNQLLDRTPNLEPKQKKYLSVVSEQVQQAVLLVRQILDFSRRSILRQTVLDILDLVEKSLTIMQHTLPTNIKLHVTYQPDEYYVYGDTSRLQQVFMNLAINARDAMPEGGTLLFALSTFSTTAEEPAPLPNMPEAGWVKLTVTDTGTGIPDDVLPHIFEPFYTTKDEGKGTGLGLSQVYGIVKQHEGSIEVANAEGGGTIFSIYLPRHPMPPDRLVEGPDPEQPRSRSGTILVVSDNPDTTAAIRDILESENHTVLSVTNSQDALAIISEQEVDLILSDLVTPTRSGMDLYRALSTATQAAPTIIISSYPMRNEADLMRQEGIVDWIQKPFSADVLVDKVARALGEA